MFLHSDRLYTPLKPPNSFQNSFHALIGLLTTDPLLLKTVLIMATHMMEKQSRQSGQLAFLADQNTQRVSSFVAHLIAGLFTGTLDFGSGSEQCGALAEGLLGYLNYDWPILN